MIKLNTKAFSALAVIALTASCGTNTQEQTIGEANVKEMPADLVAQQPSVIAMVEVDENGKVTKIEKRTISKNTAEFANAEEAEAAFQNASTGSYTENTSADSFYTTGYATVGGAYAAPYGGANSSYTSYSSNVNYNSAWNGYNYAMPATNYSSSTYYSSNIMYNNAAPAVYGCGYQNYGCYNYAYAAWPTMYYNAGPAYYGYRYPCARSYYRPCFGGCRRWYYRW